jgi:hypothetical protein
MKDVSVLILMEFCRLFQWHRKDACHWYFILTFESKSSSKWYLKIQLVPKKTLFQFKINCLMLFKKIISVHTKNYTKNIIIKFRVVDRLYKQAVHIVTTEPEKVNVDVYW